MLDKRDLLVAFDRLLTIKSEVEELINFIGPLVAKPDLRKCKECIYSHKNEDGEPVECWFDYPDTVHNCIDKGCEEFYTERKVV